MRYGSGHPNLEFGPLVPTRLFGGTFRCLRGVAIRRRLAIPVVVFRFLAFGSNRVAEGDKLKLGFVWRLSVLFSPAIGTAFGVHLEKARGLGKAELAT